MNASVKPEQWLTATPVSDTGVTSGPWRDRKKAGWLLSPGLPVLAMGIAGLVAGQNVKKRQWLGWAGPLLIHAIIPALDRLLGEDQDNPRENLSRGLDIFDRVKADPAFARQIKVLRLHWAYEEGDMLDLMTSESSPCLLPGMAI